MNHADSHGQPAPTGNGNPVTPEVILDLLQRRQQGMKKYGTELKTENGRDAKMDAYQEALDLVMYLKQSLMEDEVTQSFTDRELQILALGLRKWREELADRGFPCDAIQQYVYVSPLKVGTTPDELNALIRKVLVLAGPITGPTQ